MYRTKSRTIFYLLVLVTSKEINKTDTSFLSHLFLAKDILRNNCFSSYSFNT